MPIRSTWCSRLVSSSSSSPPPSQGPTRSLASPPTTKISDRPRSFSSPMISRRSLLPATIRAAMCGTGRWPRASRYALLRRAASMPTRGEQVTGTTACGGSCSTCASKPAMGMSSRRTSPSILRPPAWPCRPRTRTAAARARAAGTARARSRTSDRPPRRAGRSRPRPRAGSRAGLLHDRAHVREASAVGRDGERAVADHVTADVVDAVGVGGRAEADDRGGEQFAEVAGDLDGDVLDDEGERAGLGERAGAVDDLQASSAVRPLTPKPLCSVLREACMPMWPMTGMPARTISATYSAV